MLITLLTDFGLQDVYVGVMKGVILQLNPQACILDLCHQISPQDIQSASFQLASAYPYFPRGTVHVVVVDPGVGGQREAIALDLGGTFLVGPNNGVFSHVLEQYRARLAVSLDNPNYWTQPTPSATFHGRDIFAPVAAHLSLGVPCADLGQSLPLEQIMQLSRGDAASQSPDQGYIQAIDRFGNLITTLQAPQNSHDWAVGYRNRQIPLQTTYSDVVAGEAIALVGSHGWIEIAINQGNAQRHFGAVLHESIRLMGLS